jgi:cytochrome c biogenesis protein CcdA
VHEWIRQTLSVPHLGMAAVPAVFVLGLLASTTSCCSLPVLGAVAGYAGTLDTGTGRRKLFVVGVFFMLGTVLSLAALGALGGFLGHIAGSTPGRYGKLAAGLLLVLFGLAGLGLAPLRMPKVAAREGTPRHGTIGAAVYGMAVGVLGTGCSTGCNPVLAMVLAATAVKGATLLGAGVFAVFALGYSLPLAAGLVGIGLGLDRLRTTAQRLLPAVHAVAGVLLVGTGFYLLATIR